MARILVLSNMYPPHHLGGYELSCRDVTERLRARGHEPTILTTTFRLPDVAESREGERDLGIRRDLEWYWDDHVLVKPPLRRRVAIERDNQRALRHALRDGRPEVAFVWHMGAMSLGLLATLVEERIPMVFVVCDDWLVYGPNLDPWTKLFLGRPRLGALVRRLTGVPTTIADTRADAVFCFVSDATKRAAEVSPLKPRLSTVVYSGIDRRDFPVAPASDRPWRWRLLSVGRLDERKGIHVAVEALTHLPAEATLEILGRGDAAYERRLRSLARELDVSERLRFASVDREQLHRHYADADVLVFPTLWAEPFGLVPLEAMACRTPVVATGTGGSGEFLHDGANCLLVPQGDAVAVADAVRRLAGDPTLRARLVEGGVRTAEELDIDRLTDVLEEWVAAVASHFAQGRPADRRPVVG